MSGLGDEFECKHERTVITKKPMRDGRIMLVRQCRSCYQSVGPAVSQKNLILDYLPDFDQQAADEWREQREERRREQLAQARNIDWRKHIYEPYMESAHWRALRSTVIQRDGFRCQNCFGTVTLENAHCHHVSYKGLSSTGKSFAFECVTLCAQCHRDYHQSQGVSDYPFANESEGIHDR